MNGTRQPDGGSEATVDLAERRRELEWEGTVANEKSAASSLLAAYQVASATDEVGTVDPDADPGTAGTTTVAAALEPAATALRLSDDPDVDTRRAATVRADVMERSGLTPPRKVEVPGAAIHLAAESVRIPAADVPFDSADPDALDRASAAIEAREVPASSAIRRTETEVDVDVPRARSGVDDEGADGVLLAYWYASEYDAVEDPDHPAESADAAEGVTVPDEMADALRPAAVAVAIADDPVVEEGYAAELDAAVAAVETAVDGDGDPEAAYEANAETFERAADAVRLRAADLPRDPETGRVADAVEPSRSTRIARRSFATEGARESPRLQAADLIEGVSALRERNPAAADDETIDVAERVVTRVAEEPEALADLDDPEAIGRFQHAADPELAGDGDAGAALSAIADAVGVDNDLGRDRVVERDPGELGGLAEEYGGERQTGPF